MEKISKNSLYAAGSILIVVFLMFSTLSIAQVSMTDNVIEPLMAPSNNGMQDSRATHHKVLAEVGTATWCPYCPSMGQFISQVSGDFVFVSLVADMSGAANSRRMELDITGYPTAVFDGGYTQVVGVQSSVTQLQNAYNTCQARTVADVYPSVWAVYDPDADKMDITVLIDNLESETFNGYLRVYVIEPNSRWDEYDGSPYKNALLGFAMKTPFTVGPDETWSQTTNDWSFYDMSMDNLMVIATVFDSTTEYAEQTVVTYPTMGGGNGGGEPKIPPVVQITSPSHGTFVNDTVTIEGISRHPKGDGLLKYVYIKVGDYPWTQADGITSWSYEWDTTLVSDGEYLIQAICSDGNLQSGTATISLNVKNNETEDDDPVELFSKLNVAGVLQWTEVTPGEIIETDVFISNQGDVGSELSWEIVSYPDWGLWELTPESGEGLGVEDGFEKVTVLITAPNEKETEFTGSLTIVNSDNESDMVSIPITLVTPKTVNPHPWFQLFLDLIKNRFPFFTWL